VGMTCQSILPEYTCSFTRVRNRFYFRNSVRLSAEPFYLVETKKQYVFMFLSGIMNYTG
jgi:hypothetical protein